LSLAGAISIEVRQIAKLHRYPAGFNPSMASLTFLKLSLATVGIGSHRASPARGVQANGIGLRRLQIATTFVATISLRHLRRDTFVATTSL